MFGGLHSKIFEKNDLYIYSEQQKKWLLCEQESITKQESEKYPETKGKPKEIAKILINNNNFSIFSKHIKNSLSLSPLKKCKNSASFEHENSNKNDKLLSPEYKQKSALSVFNIAKKEDLSPNLKNIDRNVSGAFSSGSRRFYFFA